MVITYDIAVDLTPEFNRQLSPKFSVSLGDHGAREFTAKILQGGEPFAIEEGSTVSIVGKKQDGHIFAYACTYADEYVYFTIEEQMTPVSGIVTCELSIIDASGNKVGSANFTYWVEPSPVTDGEASESDLQLFQQILDAVDDLDDVREILEEAAPIVESATERLLHYEEIDNTMQAITFDAGGNVSEIVHSQNGSAVRTDTFTFGESTITEKRTLSTGESLTIVTNLETLSTTVTYAA